jgi:hypothetical protein
MRRALRRHGGACRNAFSKIDANSVLQNLGGFFAERVERLLAARGVAPKEKRVISCDGKQNLGSGLGGVKKANILSAFDSETGAVLAQELIEEKTNEITAMPDLIAHVGEAANGAIFTWDALNTTAKIIEEVIKAHGNYVGALKSDAGHIFGDAVAFFDMAVGIEAGTGNAIVLDEGVSTLRRVAFRGKTLAAGDCFMTAEARDSTIGASGRNWALFAWSCRPA